MNRETVVIVATYNEMGNIEHLVDRVLGVSDEVDMLVVDDNSPDGTADWVKGKMAETDRLHLVRREGKLGYGTAQAAGLKWAMENGYNAVITMDADFSHPPETIPVFLSQKENYDFMIGSRYVPGGRTVNWGVHRKLLSRCGNLFAKTFLGVAANDLTTGFRYVNRKVISTIDFSGVKMEGYGFLIETSYRIQSAGFRVKEFPIAFTDREFGKSKISHDIVVEAYLMVLRLCLRERLLGGARKRRAAMESKKR